MPSLIFGCSNNSDCEPGEMCIEGTCVPDVGGGCDPGCPDEHICLFGECISVEGEPCPCSAGEYFNFLSFDCEPCNNLPANAHWADYEYDAGCWNNNYCPWECNSGFSRVRTNTNPNDDVCVTMCATGITRLRTGTGLSIPLVAAKTNVRAIHVQTAGGICYAPLVPGQSTGALNVNIGGQIWHAR